jgi:hypothetical protein
MFNLSGLAFGIWDELVTYASNGKQVERLGWLSLNISPEAHDEIVDRTRVRILM